ncbi:hypothetical protein [Belnapia mucosa]|uniref:hypothetical protein n=1 Tax=Belnapia mucosa TaxID=2804532 RepID=UPI0038B2AA2B
MVFGDIGTSPIYAFREALRAAGAEEREAGATPFFQPYVVPLAAAVLVGLIAFLTRNAVRAPDDLLIPPRG